MTLVVQRQGTHIEAMCLLWLYFAKSLFANRCCWTRVFFPGLGFDHSGDQSLAIIFAQLLEADSRMSVTMQTLFGRVLLWGTLAKANPFHFCCICLFPVGIYEHPCSCD